MAGFTKTKREIKAMPEGNRKEAATALVREAEFIAGELKKLRADIESEGWIETYQNGENQKGVKKSSKGEVYVQLCKQLVSVVKGMTDIMPGSSTGESELEQFMKGLAR